MEFAPSHRRIELAGIVVGDLPDRHLSGDLDLPRFIEELRVFCELRKFDQTVPKIACLAHHRRYVLRLSGILRRPCCFLWRTVAR
ncbi:MAG: hypothetical protein ACREQC_02260, partial [Candidatus Binataceae bacterium]